MPIRGPRFDLRPGARANATARLVVVALICCLQYWLLTSTMEAFHAGDRGLPLPAALASIGCFLLGVGLVAVAERNETRRRAREGGDRS